MVPSLSSLSEVNAEANEGFSLSQSQENGASLPLLSLKSTAEVNAEVNTEPSLAAAAEATDVMYLGCCYRRVALAAAGEATAVSLLLLILEVGIWHQHVFFFNYF